MNSKEWRSKALSLCLIVATIATYSMVALAGSDKVAGELSVKGKSINGVLVNGEMAQSGRSVFSSSTIATPESTFATINLGTTGAIELAPKSNLILSFANGVISGELLAGTVTVKSAENSVNIKLLNGEIVKLNAGESASVGNSNAQDEDDEDDDGGGAWVIWVILISGAAAGIILAATSSNNNLDLGGGATVVSPRR